MTTIRPLLVLAATGVLLALPGLALADEIDKVSICHANSSDSNPYVRNAPDKAGDVSGHGEHLGPLWNPALKATHDSWGDIIPPFDHLENGVTEHFHGLNWDATGQAWHANSCRVPITVTVDKGNDANGDGEASDDETTIVAGAAVEFVVTVMNTSAVPANVLSITDAVSGEPVAFTPDPDPVGTTLAAGESVTFAFIVAGYAPADGDSVSNTLTAVLGSVDDPTNTGIGSDDSTVRTDVPDGGTTGGETTGETTGATTGGGTTGGTTGGDGGGSGGEVTMTPEQPFTGGGGGTTQLPSTGLDLWVLVGAGLVLVSAGSWVALAPAPLRR